MPTSEVAVPQSLKPPLKWAGGKRWLVPHLRLIWMAHHQRRFVEPLCGGLAVALGLMPRRTLLNDVNPHLMNFYKWVRQGVEFTLVMENDEDLYYKHRARFNALLEEGKGDTREAAELFYYLNRTGYNGLCRFNRKGGFNVPFGRYKRINYVREFRDHGVVFADWEFTVGGFEQVALEEEDFIYADPPYDVEFTQYSKGGFAWEDQIQLAEWLAKHRGPALISNQATKRVVALYRKLGFDVRFLEAPRRISCTGDRTPAREVLATKGV